MWKEKKRKGGIESVIIINAQKGNGINMLDQQPV